MRITPRRHLAFRNVTRKAFTLVELLVVIAIIGVLIAILLPAVQAARESARRMTCKNHLKQIALGFLTHEQQHGHFPTGGWGWRWVPDPDRGFGKRQPGGWAYNVLPYIEQLALHDLGAGAIGEEKLRLNKQRIETPVELFYCPSRRPARAYPLRIPSQFTTQIRNPFHTEPLVKAGRADYAANGGGIPLSSVASIDDAGPDTLAEGDSPTYRGTMQDVGGVAMARKRIRLTDVVDGASQTYLIGEKFLDVRWYDGISPPDYSGTYGDEIGVFQAVGAFGNNLRFAWLEWNQQQPSQDTDAEDTAFALSFGSAHAGGFHMAFCDGSVQTISYDIDPAMHVRLANREDGLPIDMSEL